MAVHPTILAFDTSAAHCAAALHWGDGQIATRYEAMAKGQGERLMGLLQELMSDEGFGWSDLDALAVGVGPGNFTGIRIAVSAARGLALGLGIPVVSVSNFEVMRGPASRSDRDPQLVSLPAPRDTVYWQMFEGGQVVGDPQIASVTADMAPIDMSKTTTVLGQHALDILNLHLFHSGQDQSQLNRAFDRVLPTAQHAETLVRIALAKWQAGDVDGTRPAPLYVKPPDAAPSREQPPVILP